MKKPRKSRRKLTGKQLNKFLAKLDSIEETPANASKIRAIENQIDSLRKKG